MKKELGFDPNTYDKDPVDYSDGTLFPILRLAAAIYGQACGESLQGGKDALGWLRGDTGRLYANALEIEPKQVAQLIAMCEKVPAKKLSANDVLKARRMAPKLADQLRGGLLSMDDDQDTNDETQEETYFYHGDFVQLTFT